MNIADKLKRKQEIREQFFKLQDWLRARLTEIAEAAPYTQTSFWCSTCKKDFETVGVKIVRKPTTSVWFAYYVGICPCGKHALRYITDKLKDPYFYRSKTVKTQQRMYPDEMLQPWQPRFRQLYPEQYQKFYLQEQGIEI